MKMVLKTENFIKTFIIAEAGVNHNGSIEIIRKMMFCGFYTKICGEVFPCHIKGLLREMSLF